MKLFKKTPSLAVCALSAMIAFGVGAETLTVTSNADSGEGTLRALLASAAAEDIIEIPANMTITLESMLTLPKKTVTIRGNGKTSIISGNNAVRLLEINYGKAVRYNFESLVLEKGYNGAGAGAGFKFTAAANAAVVMNDCIVRDMSVTPAAGKTATFELGVFMHGGSDTFDFYATNTVFTGLWGGCAIQTVGNNYGHSNHDFVLSKCELVNNGDAEGHPGYSLLDITVSEGGQAILDKCLIAGNVSSNTAAVAYCGSSKSETRGFVFRDCIITNNVTITGSGMFNMAYGRHRFENCVISDNSADNSGVYTSTAQRGYGAEFINCLMERNVATRVSDAYDKMGLFFVRQPPTSEYDEIILLSNCVVRANDSACANLFGTYDGGGILRFVDTEISDNIVRGTQIMKSSKTNVFTRCAIVGNHSNPLHTTESSNGLFTGQYSEFDNCLIVSNDMRRTRYVFSSKGSFVGCTVVSNTCSSQYTYPAFAPTAGSAFVDTVILGTMCAADHKTVENDITCGSAPAVTNCYFERAQSVSSAVGTGIHTGKSMADLGLQWELTTNGSKTVFLDGSRMPTMTFVKSSPLRNAGVDHPLLGGLDLVRGKRGRLGAPDIGCWEFPETALVLIVR